MHKEQMLQQQQFMMMLMANSMGAGQGSIQNLVNKNFSFSSKVESELGKKEERITVESTPSSAWSKFSVRPEIPCGDGEMIKDHFPEDWTGCSPPGEREKESGETKKRDGDCESDKEE